MRFTLLFFVCIFIISTAFAQAPAPASSNIPQPSVNQPAPTANQPAPSNQPAASNQPVASGSQQPAPTGTQAAPSGSIAAPPNGTALPTVPAGGGQNNSVAALPTSASYGNSVFPGSFVIVQPTPSKSVSPLYRIDPKGNVTFAWSYTNLLVRPAAITLAAVAPNKITYTFATVGADQTTAVWQFKDVPAASPLMMGMYSIQLHDQGGPSALPQPGWLAPYTKLTIALYTAEPDNGSNIEKYCPLCFYNAGRRISENIGSMMMAFGIACVTSSVIVYGLLY